MDYNTTFGWLSVAASVALLLRWRTEFAQRQNLGWAAVALIILAANAGGAFLFPAISGWVGGGLWLVFMLAPTLLTRGVRQSALRGRFEQASRLARLVSILHPADSWPQQPALYRALALAQKGDADRAASILRELIARPGAAPVVVQSAQTYLFRLLGEWEELLTWMRTLPTRRLGVVSITDATLLAMRLRALGETGRLSEMLAAYQARFLQMEHLGGPAAAGQCLLVVLAFAGRVDALEKLLAGTLSDLPLEMKRFWIATARMAAGEPADLRALRAETADHSLRLAIDRRLAQGAPQAVFTPPERMTLDFIETTNTRDSAYRPHGGDTLRHAPVVAILILCNLAAYALEVRSGGGENLRTLLRLGALWAPAVVEGGQWHRLVSAMFLHFGVLHLAMNMIGLAIIGPWVERMMGHTRFAVVYLASGVGSMAAVVWFIRRGWMPLELLVGASGAIMGLIGAYGTLLALGWRRERSRFAARRLRGVALIVVAQTVFDLMNPQVSFAAHMSGLVCGAMLTLPLMPRRLKKTAGAGARLP